MKQKKLQLSVFLLGFCLSIQAQEAVSTTGGDASGSGGTVAYTVGQAVYTTNTGATGTISQGVQQSYEIFPTNIDNTIINVGLSVYPNPTTDNLIIEVEDYNNEKLTYQLIDLQGKVLSSNIISSNEYQINMNSYSKAVYILNVIQDNNKVQSFKIIKK